MSLVVYNSQSKKKEKFEPLVPGQVKMYCCGPTVYDLLHVGNFRGAIFYNLVRNWLEKSGYQVQMIYNYTDVDDKIINRANQDGLSSDEVARKYIIEFEKDFNRLGLRQHSLNPKVTETMPEIIQMIQDLIAKGKAYAVGGDVNYSIPSFSEYGKLSHRKPEDMMVGVRIDKDEKKKSPLDFALWKGSKEGEPSWPSPWGPGRPGWHIECSAMAKKHLGEQIDIHGGGMDLIFPHHENEIAQSEGCSGRHYVKYWMHNNMIEFGGAKMSKSLGNVRTGRAFMDEYNPEILKYLILSVHYRSVSDLSEQSVENAIKGLSRIYSSLALADYFIKPDVTPSADPKYEATLQEAWNKITEALNDDFNTPEAFAQVFEVVRGFNSQMKRGMKNNPAVSGKAVAFKKFVVDFGGLMSLFQENPTHFLKTLDDMLLNKMNIQRDDIDKIVQERTQVRANKDFKRSDELRDQLTKMGISVSDTPEGSFWEVTK